MVKVDDKKSEQPPTHANVTTPFSPPESKFSFSKGGQGGRGDALISSPENRPPSGKFSFAKNGGGDAI